MEVTKKNFKEVFPHLQEAINDSDFVSLDTELTGLFDEDTTHSFDEFAERYTKYREHCLSFIVVQFGLSTFKYHEKEDRYSHQDFNFYIFPDSYMKQAPDRAFLCQTSSLHFLADNDFDFNKVIYEGIPYLTPAQEDEAKSILELRHENEQNALLSAKGTSKSNGKEIDIPDEHKQFIKDVNEQVDSFMADDNKKVLELDTCNSYQRKLIYETVRQRHQSGIDMSSEKNCKNEMFIKIIKVTDEEKVEKLNSKQVTDKEGLDSAVGFRKVLDVISRSRKLVVGHNMTLDVMHLLNQFYFPLPEDLKEFKLMVREIFPRICDTKVLASSEKLSPFFETTHLMGLVKQLQGKAFNVPKIESVNCGYELGSEKAHEGGFDAFATGFCFIVLTRKLGSIQKPPLKHVDLSSKILSPFINRIYLMKRLEVPFFNLSGPDPPEPKRDNVFYVRFPSEWKTCDLNELFAPYGKIFIDWIDDFSALVAVKDSTQVANATSLVKKTNNVFSVELYTEYKNKVGFASEQLNCSSSFKPDSNSKKRKANDSAKSSESISESTENEAEKADHSDVTTKKQKQEDNEDSELEVSSTAPVFDEDNQW